MSCIHLRWNIQFSFGYTWLSSQILLGWSKKHNMHKTEEKTKQNIRKKKKRVGIASLMHRACCPKLFLFALAQREPFLSGQRTPFAWAISKTGTDSPWQILPLHEPWEIAGWGWSRQRGVPAVTLARWAQSIWRTKNQQWAVSGATYPSG